MKLKHFLCAVVATTVLATSAVSSAFAENSIIGISTQKEAVPTAAEYVVTKDTEYVVTEDTVKALGLENPCFVSKDGSVEIQEGVLIDLILPKELNEEALTSIAAKSFAGCPYIRSVVVPETILEIGDEAFADCEFLETIYIFGHGEKDLTLGENWSGGSEVVYVKAALESVSITKAPDKVEYTIGDAFDDTGMEVTAAYVDGSTKVIEDYVIEGGDALTADTASVKISYTDGDVTVSCTVDVTVRTVEEAENTAEVSEEPGEGETPLNSSEKESEPSQAANEGDNPEEGTPSEENNASSIDQDEDGGSVEPAATSDETGSLSNDGAGTEGGEGNDSVDSVDAPEDIGEDA